MYIFKLYFNEIYLKILLFNYSLNFIILKKVNFI
jgi:hypothetical protein